MKDNRNIDIPLDGRILSAYHKGVVRALTNLKGQRSWTQFSEESGIDKSTMSRILSGERELSDLVVAKLAPVINLSISEFHKVIALDALQQNSHDLKSFLRRGSIGSEYLEDVLDIHLGLLEPEDRYTLITMEIPWELSSREFESVVLKKAKEGVYIDYVVPDSFDNYFDISNEDTCFPVGLDEHLLRIGSVDLAKLISIWKTSKISRESDPRLSAVLNKHINVFVAPLNTGMLLFAPYIKYLLIHKQKHNTNDILKRSWCEVMSLSNDDNSRIFLELNNNATHLIELWLNSVPKQYEHTGLHL